MKASSMSFSVEVLLALVGMVWGITMAISQDHSTMPAHAHLNLLGWVSLFLFGVFYHLHPTIDRGRTAVIQLAIWIVGTVVLTVGVGLVHSGTPAGDPIAGIGSLIVVAGMVLFGWIVVRRDQNADVADRVSFDTMVARSRTGPFAAGRLAAQRNQALPGRSRGDRKGQG